MTSAPVGRPEKYETHVQPHLAQIKILRENGMKMEALAKHLNIAPDTLYRYKNLYPELSEILTTAKEKLHAEMVIRAEESIFTILRDRTVTETRLEEYVDDKGQTATKTVTSTKVIPANAAALIFTLKNRDPDHWRDRTEVDATVMHGVIPQPLAPVREQDILPAETVEPDDETD